MSHRRLELLALTFLAAMTMNLAGCRTIESEIRDQNGDDFQADAELDDDAVTVGDDTGVEDASADTTVAPDSGIALDQI